MSQDIINADTKLQESGSAHLIALLLGVSGIALFVVIKNNTALWPDGADFLWNLGYFVGRLDRFDTAVFTLGAVCLAAALFLQTIRFVFLLFRTSRR